MNLLVVVESFFPIETGKVGCGSVKYRGKSLKKNCRVRFVHLLKIENLSSQPIPVLKI